MIGQKNLNEVPDGDYLEPGTYTVKVTKVINDDKCYTEKGTPYFVLIYEDALGCSIRDTFYDTEKAYFRWKALAKALKFTDEQFAQFTPEACLGYCLEIDVEPQKDNPQYMQVAALRPTNTPIIVSKPDPKSDVPF